MAKINISYGHEYNRAGSAATNREVLKFKTIREQKHTFYLLSALKTCFTDFLLFNAFFFFILLYSIQWYCFLDKLS